MARKIECGERALEELENINNEILGIAPQPKKKPLQKATKKKDTELVSHVKEIDKTLDAKIGQRISCLSTCEVPKTLSHVSRLQKTLASYIHHTSSKQSISIEALYNSFNQLVEIDPESSVIESSKILKVLKIFKEEFIDSKDGNLRSLAKLSHKLYLFWKREVVSAKLSNSITNLEEPTKPHENSAPTVEIKVPDPDLRKKACRKICKVLEKNRFGKNEAQKLAINIEKNLRKKDPSMSEQYKRFFNMMLKDIKQLDWESYDRSKTKLAL